MDCAPQLITPDTNFILTPTPNTVASSQILNLDIELYRGYLNTGLQRGYLNTGFTCHDLLNNY